MSLRPVALLLLFLPALLRAAPEAILVAVGDMHSGYARVPQFVARIDRLRAEHPGVPMAILIDGDCFEYGNTLSRRTQGAIDFALFAALVQRAPTVLNLGNHDSDLWGMSDIVAKLSGAGVTVISGNAISRETGRPFAPPSTRLKLGAHELTIVGITTDNLATFRVAVRPQLDLRDPVTWARQNFPSILHDAPVPVVMSHAGLKADKQLLPVVPDGTLFMGAHDHLLLFHRERRTVYFHSGSWLSGMAVAVLANTPAGLAWDVSEQSLVNFDPGDEALGKVVAETSARGLTAEDLRVVGHTAHAMSPHDAALFAVAAAKSAAGADAAVIGATSFGDGLPAGDVTQYAFDSCVRFNGTLYVGEIDGTQLKNLLARCNQDADTPFALRSGENLLGVGPAPGTIEPGRRYRIATTDWMARNLATLLPANPPKLTEQPALKLKAAVAAALIRP